MWRRKLLYDEATARRLFGEMQRRLDEIDAQRLADLAAMAARHASELGDLQRDIVALTAEHEALRATILARSKTEHEVAELRRLQAIGRAQAQERDPATALN